MIQLGYMYTALAGDYRYTDRVEVQLDELTGKVHIIVSSRVPAGGMDGPGGVGPYEVQEECTFPPRPDAVMKGLKTVLSNTNYTFKRYGKATKNFIWCTPEGEKKGLTKPLVAAALTHR